MALSLWWSVCSVIEMSYFDCRTAICLNQLWYFSGTLIVHGLCKPILKVSVLNSYIKLTLFIECYWPNTAKKPTQRHKDLLRMATSRAKACSWWKRINALNSLNNTAPMNVCNSGQSQFVMCRTLCEEKLPSFSEGSSPCAFTPLLLFVKTQRNKTKIWPRRKQHIHPVS